MPQLHSGWTDWADVPRDAHEVAQLGPFFLEIFSGTARLTETVRSLGIPCLPPVDITLCSTIPTAFDVLDCDRWSFVMELAERGALFFVHCGTPCNTYSAARKDDGGPPPLRSMAHPEGLPHLAPELQWLVLQGNLFTERSCELCAEVARHGGDFSIENPLESLLWQTALVAKLQERHRAFAVDFHQCQWGAPSMKPTRLMVTHAQFDALAHLCTGGHKHIVLKGKVYSEFFGRVVFRTKLAQEYPWPMCETMALAIFQIWQEPLQLMTSSFGLLLEKGDRKRPLGQAITWNPHRQAVSAALAIASGYQLKRGAVKPLLEHEMEPGQAIEWALSVDRPFSTDIRLDPALQKAILALRAPVCKVRQQRPLQTVARSHRFCRSAVALLAPCWVSDRWGDLQVRSLASLWQGAEICYSG